MAEQMIEVGGKKFPGLRDSLKHFGFKTYLLKDELTQGGKYGIVLTGTVTLTGEEPEIQRKLSTIEGILSHHIGPTKTDFRKTDAGIAAKTVLQLVPTQFGQTKHTQVFGKAPQENVEVKEGDNWAYLYKINSKKTGVGTHAIEIHVATKPSLKRIIERKLSIKGKLVLNLPGRDKAKKQYAGNPNSALIEKLKQAASRKPTFAEKLQARYAVKRIREKYRKSEV